MADQQEWEVACHAALTFCAILREIHGKGHLLPAGSLPLKLKFEEALVLTEERCRLALGEKSTLPVSLLPPAVFH